MPRDLAETPPAEGRELLLVGGGHAHLGLLRSLVLRPIPGLRVTLVADELAPVYSGMLPGLVAGLYAAEECVIALPRLALAAGARLIQDRATGLQPAARRLLCARHPPLRYDWLSIDTGSVARPLPPGEGPLIAVRPIGSLEARLAAALPAGRAAVVGGGAAGVELAFSLRRRLGPGAELALLPGAGLLPRSGPLACWVVRRALARRRIALVEGAPVAEARPGALLLADGRRIPCDLALWTTGAAAPAWLRETGLALDPQGFIAVDETHRSLSHREVFAAGDVAALQAHPREKAGVYPVRQGPALADAIRRLMAGEMPRPWRPQRRALALIGTADGEAIALRGRIALAGRWAWRWKQRIDRDWVAGFAGLRVTPPVPMHCGGRLAAPALAAALARLGLAEGPASPGDAALRVQGAERFPALLGDGHLLGRIAANHAMGEMQAMGARPLSALALVTLPHAPAAWLEEDLHAMLRGAQEVLEEAGARLIGGHGTEGAEVALGFAVTGAAGPGRLPQEGGLRPGDRLVLTKPLGTGVILAAAMRGEARAAWLEGAVAAMQQPGGPAAAALIAHGATACAAVKGFGLLGQLGELLRASGSAALLDAAAIPLLPGVREALERGIRSPRHAANEAAIAGLAESPPAALLDPQTAGGFLAGLPEASVAPCLAELRRLGAAAALIGTVTPGPPAIRLG